MTPEQIAQAGFFAYVIVQVIKVFFIGLLGLPKPSKLVFSVIAVVAATLMAYLYAGPVALPDPAVDPFAFVQALLLAAGAVFTSASVFYFFILDRLLAGIDSLTFARWVHRRVLAP